MGDAPPVDLDRSVGRNAFHHSLSRAVRDQNVRETQRTWPSGDLAQVSGDREEKPRPVRASVVGSAVSSCPATRMTMSAPSPSTPARSAVE
ncbi:hypothetical protein [Streptomyces sp. NPDC059513]|uniref:hypothetical protein n=1 Tax=unclassified Streptomyces TaxID=2593676 RepID=UPI00367D5C63